LIKNNLIIYVFSLCVSNILYSSSRESLLQLITIYIYLFCDIIVNSSDNDFGTAEDIKDNNVNNSVQ